MIIKYPISTVPTVDIKIENDTVKIGFANATKQLFIQITTSYSSNGTNIGQSSVTLNKDELKEYMNVLEEMYNQM